MENQTKINTAFTLALIATFTVIIITGMEPTHYCESRQLKAPCLNLSSTGKTCYTLPARTGGKRCTEGWQEIPAIPTVKTERVLPQSGKHWECSPEMNDYQCERLN